MKPAEAEIAAGLAAQAGKIDEVAIHFILVGRSSASSPNTGTLEMRHRSAPPRPPPRTGSRGSPRKARICAHRELLLDCWNPGMSDRDPGRSRPCRQSPAQALPRRPEPPSTSTLEPSVLPEPSLVASPPPPPPPPPPGREGRDHRIGFNANPWTSAASATPASAAASPHHGTGARYAESRACSFRPPSQRRRAQGRRPRSSPQPSPLFPCPTAPSSGPPVLPPPAATEAPPEPPILPKTVPAGIHGDRPGPLRAKFVLPSRTSLGRYEGGPLGRSMFPLRSVLKPRHGQNRAR